jgi:hypothetical protein
MAYKIKKASQMHGLGMQKIDSPEGMAQFEKIWESSLSTNNSVTSAH